MFEEIVRPFQATSIVAKKKVVYAISEDTTSGTATLTWGRAGTIEDGAAQDKETDLGISFKVKDFNPDHSWVQTGKLTDVIRIKHVDSVTGIEDDTQFVDVKRIKSISFKDKKKRPAEEKIISTSTVYNKDLFPASDYDSVAAPQKNERAKFTLNFDGDAA